MQPNTFTHRQATPAQGKPGGFSFLKKLGALMLVLVGAGASQQAWGQSGSVTDDIVSLTVQPTNQAAQPATNYAGSDNNGVYTYSAFLGQSDDTTVPVPALGTYDLNGNSSLVISGASLQGSVTSNNTTVSNTRLRYRVYLQGTAAANLPSYSNLTLTTNQSSATAFSGSASSSIQLLQGLTSGGTYIIDVQFQADASRTSTAANGTSTTKTTKFTDPQTGGYFYATFYVTPPPTTPAGGTTTWQGVARGTSAGGTPQPLPSDSDWNNSANWSNGVPTASSNAIIPATGNNSSVVYPILTGPASGTTTTATYRVNNLTLQGAQNSNHAIVTVNNTVLRVYGDIQQPGGGLQGNTNGTTGATDSTSNSTLILRGKDQLITGNLTFSDIIVSGSGTKSVIKQLIPTNILAFQPNSTTDGVIVQSASQDTSSGTITTVFDTSGGSYVQLPASSSISLVPGQAETNVSYIKGVTRAERQITANSQNKFGNIGIDITTNHTPGSIIVYRVVGDALNSPPNSTAVPIKRQYTISGDDNSNSSATSGSTLDVVFHYLDSADELNGINEQNLAMFRTQSNGAPYAALGGTLDIVNNTVTRAGINSLTNFTLTLGDKTNPLPVTLSAFAAVRSGDKALITWSTATEENNKGFNVQVSTDGVKYRNLGFVDSKVINSVQTQNYSFTDAESGKTGTRYYRLEQVDVNGKVSYSPVRAVSFSGAAATSLSLAASPNPFSDQLALSFDGLSAPDGTVHVKIVDMTGRTIRDQDLSMSGASIALGNLSDLRSGLYLAKVTLADGTTKTVRIQRQ